MWCSRKDEGVDDSQRGYHGERHGKLPVLLHRAAAYGQRKRQVDGHRCEQERRYGQRPLPSQPGRQDK